jgi:predicted LPLAT superfamily acyltransferase
MTAETPDRAGHWARLEERGVYLGLRCMLLAYRVLGRGGFSLLLYPVIAYFFLAGGAARRASLDYLRAIYAMPQGKGVFPGQPGWRDSFRHFMCFGDAVLDKLLAWTGKIGPESVEFENLEIFEALQNSGGGGVLIASHLGNAEVCRALGARKESLKINVLVHTKHAENFNKLMREQSYQSTVSLIETTEVGPDTAIMLRERVENGEFIVIVGDRTPASLSSRYSFATFLGRTAPFPQGPYILAALMRCPVQLMFCLKQEGRFRIVFEPFSDGIKLPRKNRNEALDGLAALYARRLEHHCLKVPFQWFNFFDFWKQAVPHSIDAKPGAPQ